MDFVIKVLITAAIVGQSHVESAIRIPRLSLVEKSPTSYYYNNIAGHPGAYTFNYNIMDEASGNTQYRNEERYSNGTVAGSYGFVDPFGTPQRFRYVADQAGYRVFREFFNPFYGPSTTVKPIDKGALDSTESSVTWTRPKKPNRNKDHTNNIKIEKYSGNRRYNLIGRPSVYVPYD